MSTLVYACQYDRNHSEGIHLPIENSSQDWSGIKRAQTATPIYHQLQPIQVYIECRGIVNQVLVN
jgi:hypothetical protein